MTTIEELLEQGKSERQILVCEKCGGVNIECTAWVDVNTNEFCAEHVSNNNFHWCRDCKDNVHFSNLEDWKTIRKNENND